jgi:hypothetical protein
LYVFKDIKYITFNDYIVSIDDGESQQIEISYDTLLNTNTNVTYVPEYDNILIRDTETRSLKAVDLVTDDASLSSIDLPYLSAETFDKMWILNNYIEYDNTKYPNYSIFLNNPNLSKNNIRVLNITNKEYEIDSLFDLSYLLTTDISAIALTKNTPLYIYNYFNNNYAIVYNDGVDYITSKLTSVKILPPTPTTPTTRKIINAFSLPCPSSLYGAREVYSSELI